MKPILLQSIHIELSRSNLIFGLLSDISIACCLILFNLPIPLYVTLATIVLIIISTLYFILRDALLMLPWSWQMLHVDTNGKLTITNQRG